MFVARAASIWHPSGMNKSGTANVAASWAQVTGWTADTTTYPGSTVTSNALNSQGSKSSASISCSIAWSAGSFGNTVAVRVKQNGTVIATGSGSTSSPSTASATVNVGGGDTFTIEMQDTSGNASNWPAVVTSGSTSYLHVT